jgi:hypothetical protein
MLPPLTIQTADSHTRGADLARALGPERARGSTSGGAGARYGDASDRRRERASEVWPAACACSRISAETGRWRARSAFRCEWERVVPPTLLMVRSGPGSSGTDGLRSDRGAGKPGPVNLTHRGFSCAGGRPCSRARAGEGEGLYERWRRRQVRGRIGSTARARERKKLLKGNRSITLMRTL